MKKLGKEIMKSSGFIALLLIAITASSHQVHAQTTHLNGYRFDYIDGQWYQIEQGYPFEVNNREITVKYLPSITENQIHSLNDSLDVSILRKNILGYYDLQIPSGSDPIEMIQIYAASDIAAWAFPNTFGKFGGEPDDSLFSQQWSLQDTLVDAPGAWNYETGDSSVIIAVIDVGAEILHEDLEANIWVNPGEDLDGDRVVWDLDDIDYVDSDDNEFVDDLCGWDFADTTDPPYNPRGPHWHGTHVAGIIGAHTNNSIGVSGLSGGWYPNVGNRLMILQIAYKDFLVKPDFAVVDDAILYAAQMGAKIISLTIYGAETPAIAEAIAYAYESYGCFIECISGNTGGSQPPVWFPGRARYVFAVGATDQSDKRANFSCYGDSLDVVAPGVDILSTADSSHGYYTLSDGTCMAAPHTAGIAGLLWSYNSKLTNKDIEMIIASTADTVRTDLYQYNQTRKYGPWDDEMGYGRVNAYKAIASLKSGDITSNQTWSKFAFVIGDVTISNNVTLTIEPGTTVKFAAHSDVEADGADTNRCELVVQGTLVAEGTPSNPIVFSSNSTDPQPGDWYGIRFTNSSVDSTCVIENCYITQAQHGIYCDQASPKITNNQIGHCVYGVLCENASPVVTNNKIILNNSSAIFSSGSPIPNLGDLSNADTTDDGRNEIWGNQLWEVFNDATDTVQAENNWWGQYPPDSSRFSGLVDYSPSSDHPFQPDTIAPVSISDLKPTLIKTPPDSGVVLQWSKVLRDINGKPEFLSHYVIYRDSSPDFEPTKDNSLAVVMDTCSEYFDIDAVNEIDINYFYAVIAVDYGKNKSKTSNMVGEFDISLTEKGEGDEPPGPPKD
jgi:subtilisin family serine protease